MVTIDPCATVSPASLRARGSDKWTRYDEDVHAAWVADMDFTAAEPIRATVARMAERSAFGYWPMLDPIRLFDAATGWLSRWHGWAPDPLQFVKLIDVTQGINIALQVFTEPGDGVIVQGPIYPPFLVSIEEQGRTVVDNRIVDIGGAAEMDVDGLRRAAADPRTRLLLLCSPHNPSGRVWRRDELEAVAAIAIEHDLIVIADEIWMDIVYPGHRHTPFQTLAPEIAARTITLTSATKTFSLGGLPVAVAICGSPALQERFTSFPPHLLGMPSAINAEATIAAWTEGAPWHEAVLRQLDANRHQVERFVRERLPGVRFRSPDGTYLAWLDASALNLEGSLADLLLERGRVALNPGVDFGGADCCARLNFATTPEILQETCERIAAVIG